MPHLMLNGMTSHTFAAVMTATVVMFPTPEDLWSAIMKEPPSAVDASIVSAGVPRDVPVAVTPDTPIPGLVSALTQCVGDQSGAMPTRTSECERVVSAAAVRVATNPNPNDVSAAAEKLKLARALICRQQWAAARSGNRPFDVGRCRAGVPQPSTP